MPDDPHENVNNSIGQIKKANRSPKKPFEINKSNNFMPSNAIANTNLKIQTNDNTLSSSLSL